MFRIFSIIAIITAPFFGQCQMLTFEVGRVISSFDFRDSSGEQLEGLKTTNNLALAAGYRRSFQSGSTKFTQWKGKGRSLGNNRKRDQNESSLFQRLFVSGKVSYRSYGAVGSDEILGNFMEWNVNYLGANLALDFEILRYKNLSFYLTGGGSHEWLLQGTQTLNNQTFNLKGEDEFSQTAVFFNGGLGILLAISDDISLKTEYIRARSLDTGVGQESLIINAQSFAIGVHIGTSQF